MPIPIIETCRKRKRRPKIFGLHMLAEPGYLISQRGTFRENVKVFLRNCAELEEYGIEGMTIWCTLISHETKGFVVPLYTLEEDVKHSLQPYCDHCRCTGWSNHFMSRRKYHFIIPVETEWNMPLDDGLFDLQTHLLHGLIHSSGFGHLICVNGIEGGSKSLTGREIMDLWDSICTNLETRKITVEDLSKKRSMELRLLYGVAYGHPWFGKWGYKFHHGTYGVSQQDYERAIEVLSSMGLDHIVSDFSDREGHQEIKETVCFYRELSEGHLATLRDLLRFMLTIKTCSLPPKRKLAQPSVGASAFPRRSSKTVTVTNTTSKERSPNYKAFSTVAANMGSRWPVRRLEYAAEIIVEALKEAKTYKLGHGAMTRQDVRDAARMHIGDTGLLDYVLKSMNNVIVGDFVVRRAVNPTTRVLHYTINKLGNGAMASKSEAETTQEMAPRKSFLQPGIDVYSDLFFLYNSILLYYPDSQRVGQATQAVLDSKHFVKEWPIQNLDRRLTFICSIAATCADQKHNLLTEFQPGEVIVVPLDASILELKESVGNALRDTYCVLENFVVIGIDKLDEASDEELVFGKLASGSEIVVSGFGIDRESRLKYQGGCETWMVRCECGARDDDGERMVACDVCEVWQHTRCYGISDSDTLPPLFVCSGCCDSFTEQSENETAFGARTSKALLQEAAEASGSLIEYDDCLALLLSPESVFLD